MSRRVLNIASSTGLAFTVFAASQSQGQPQEAEPTQAPGSKLAQPEKNQQTKFTMPTPKSIEKKPASQKQRGTGNKSADNSASDALKDCWLERPGSREIEIIDDRPYLDQSERLSSKGIELSKMYLNACVKYISTVWNESHPHEGPVLLIRIANDGHLISCEIKQASTSAALDAEAVATIKTLKFPGPPYCCGEQLDIDLANPDIVK